MGDVVLVCGCGDWSFVVGCVGLCFFLLVVCCGRENMMGDVVLECGCGGWYVGFVGCACVSLLLACCDGWNMVGDVVLVCGCVDWWIVLLGVCVVVLGFLIVHCDG